MRSAAGALSILFLGIVGTWAVTIPEPPAQKGTTVVSAAGGQKEEIEKIDDLDDKKRVGTNPNRGRTEDEKKADRPMSRDQLGTLHGKLDQDKDGKVSAAELRAFGERIRKDIFFEGNKVLRLMDTNKDKWVNFAELEEFVSKDRTWPSEGKHHEALASLQKRFDAADADGDKELNDSEIRVLFHAADATTHDDVLDVHVAETLAKKDKEGDGKLSVDEFYGTSDRKWSPTSRQRDTFKKLDKDGDGLLDALELRRWESNEYSVEEVLKDLLEAVDKDGDQHLHLDELHHDDFHEDISYSHHGILQHLKAWSGYVELSDEL